MAYDIPTRIPKIQTQTASSSASLSFTTGFGNFSTYLIKIRKVVAATNAVQLYMTWSTDGGSTYLSTNYLHSNYQFTSSGGRNYAASAGSAAQIPITNSNGNLSSVSTRDINADIVLYNLAGTRCPTCTLHAALYNSSGTPVADCIIGGGMNTTTSAINGIKFAMSSGNIASGTITLYGIQDGGFIY